MSGGSVTQIQAPSAVVMIRPHHFVPNPQTAEDNSFQSSELGLGDKSVEAKAFDEVGRAREVLEDHGISVHLFEDTGTQTPDSVFPNNWFSTHPGGHVAVYPMFTPNRRLERRQDVLELLKREYRVQQVVDYSGLERDDVFLEGTGAMVLDHVERIAYAVRSNRTDPVMLERFCTTFNYEPWVFDAVDHRGETIYHTNVLMCIATSFAMVGLDAITSESRRTQLKNQLQSGGREVIGLSNEQVQKFAGNAIELTGAKGKILALSATAYDSLTQAQLSIIRKTASPVVLDVPTIEMAGGSVRCMLAGLHLSRR
ncbi:MAG: arginine deiminase-related protein [Pseudomonadota bacterium]